MLDVRGNVIGAPNSRNAKLFKEEEGYVRSISIRFNRRYESLTEVAKCEARIIFSIVIALSMSQWLEYLPHF
jgi:hypothetical protein